MIRRASQTQDIVYPSPQTSSRRIFFLTLSMSAVLLLLAGRLIQIQFVDHERFLALSDANRKKATPLPAQRGRLISRDGLTLADNRPVYALVHFGGHPAVPEWERIRSLLNLPSAALPTLPSGQQQIILRTVPVEKISAVSEWLMGQSALRLVSRIERTYPEGELAGNVLGYLGEANEEEVSSGRYRAGQLVGRSGLEASLDDVLRGQDGVEIQEVNVRAIPQRQISTRAAQAGKTITLTLDAHLQQIAQQALLDAKADINRYRRDHRRSEVTTVQGAVIALDPRNGEILVLASAPALNPNWFIQQPRPEELVLALTGKSGRLQNRAAQAYAPGSVFKTTSTLAYVDTYGDKTYPCPPGIMYGGRYKRNWAKRDFGPQDARGAIANSCNPWYYQAAIDRGPKAFSDVLAKYARAVGYGQPTGVELLGERAGLVPSASVYEGRGSTWYPGFTLNYAIGQGDLLATPLQVAQALTITLNSGQRVPLSLVKAVDSTPVSPKPPQSPVIQIQPESWQLIREGMAQTVSQGTATQILGPEHFPVLTGGKTGTAETSQGTAMEHSWYQGYGPLDRPDLVVVVFLENGGEGSGAALEVTRKVMAAHWKVAVSQP